jgi:hypothetical protein
VTIHPERSRGGQVPQTTPDFGLYRIRHFFIYFVIITKYLVIISILPPMLGHRPSIRIAYKEIIIRRSSEMGSNWRGLCLAVDCSALMMMIRRTGHNPPRGSSADWWVLTTSNIFTILSFFIIIIIIIT